MTDQTTPQYPLPPQRRTLTRSTTDRWISGVCGGIADYAGWDPTMVRIVTLVLFLVGFGTVGVAYVVAWILMPKEKPTSLDVPSTSPAP